jgi:hypothetical protein
MGETAKVLGNLLRHQYHCHACCGISPKTTPATSKINGMHACSFALYIGWSLIRSLTAINGHKSGVAVGPHKFPKSRNLRQTYNIFRIYHKKRVSDEILLWQTSKQWAIL